MILLGLIVMLGGAVLGGATLLASRGAVEAVTLSVFGFTRETGPLELLFVGGLSGFTTCLGLALVVGALRGRARRRREEELEDRIDELEEIHEDELDRVRHAVAEAKLKDADFTRREQAMAERAAQIEARERELGLRTGPSSTREHAARPAETTSDRPTAPPSSAPSGSYDRPSPGGYDRPAPGGYDGPPTSAYDPREATGGSSWPEAAPPRQVQRRRRSSV